MAEIAAVLAASVEPSVADRDGCTIYASNAMPTPPTSFGHALAELALIKMC
jgi:hypothetical protein